ncbi:MAG: serine hydrolase [Acidimicrobiaceae bacterium]|nr:serine hydrolase [Acidimicrobiaceae bacterium]
MLNGELDLRADFVQMFPDKRVTISDTIEALATIGGGAWEVVDDRSTATVTRVTIQAPGSRRYDIAYRSVGDTYGMFVAMPRSVDEASVGEAKVGYSIAHLGESGCEQLAGENSDDRFPVSSVSKLAVVGATLDAVEAGWLRMDDQLEIHAQDRSLPSGTWHTLPVGAKRSVAEAMSAALHSSDNTANDLLIRAVGRASVHDFAVNLLGHDPELPFLTTVELFKLSWSADTELRSRFVSGDFQERLTILVEDVPTLPMPVLDYDEEPVEHLQIQWFGRPDALCAVWAVLLADSRWDELVEPLMAPPEFELQGWHSLGHKAGYAPGNRGFSGVAELDCGEIVSYSGAVAFGDAGLDVESAFYLANILSNESLAVEETVCG